MKRRDVVGVLIVRRRFANKRLWGTMVEARRCVPLVKKFGDVKREAAVPCARQKKWWRRDRVCVAQ